MPRASVSFFVDPQLGFAPLDPTLGPFEGTFEPTVMYFALCIRRARYTPAHLGPTYKDVPPPLPQLTIDLLTPIVLKNPGYTTTIYRTVKKICFEYGRYSVLLLHNSSVSVFCHTGTVTFLTFLNRSTLTNLKTRSHLELYQLLSVFCVYPRTV